MSQTQETPAPVPADGSSQQSSSPYTPEQIERARRAVEIYERTVTHNPFFPKEVLKGANNPEGKPHEKQQRFLLHAETLEVFYGGAAGGAKSSGLLMAALQFVQTPGYAALLLRRSFPDLNQPDALIPLSKKWLKGHEQNGVRWSERDRRWTFPSGATLTFGYLDRPDQMYQYQGAAYQFCVAPETPVLMADGTYKPIVKIKTGEEVMTLEGARPVTRTHPLRYEDAVEVAVYSEDGTITGKQIQSERHALLTEEGWASYADIACASRSGGTDLPTECLPAHRFSPPWLEQLLSDQPHLAGCILDREQGCGLPQESAHRPCEADVACLVADRGQHAPFADKVVVSRPYESFPPRGCRGGRKCAESSSLRCPTEQPHSCSRCSDQPPEGESSQQAPCHQCVPDSSACAAGSQSDSAAFGDSRQGVLPPASWFGRAVLHEPSLPSDACDSLPRDLRHDADDARSWTSVADCPAHCSSENDPYGGQPLRCEDASLECLPSPGDVGRHSPTGSPSDAWVQIQKHTHFRLRYAHPYTMGTHQSSESVSSASFAAVPCGKRILCDITVAGTSHYITEAGLVNQNCGFDELTQFPEECYLYLFSRLRRTEGVDVPLRMRSTSNPGGKHHEWVKNRFIDPKRRGELGAVYIPATLKDNPSIVYDEYVKSLMHLDPITRKQLLEGDWEAYKGGRFQLDWFKTHTWRFDGQRFQLTHGNMEAGDGIPVNRCPIIVTVDHANTVKTSSDYTVFLACAVTPWKQLLVLDMKRDKMPVEQIPVLLKAFCRRVEDQYGHPPVWAGVEANGAQVAIANQCRILPGMVPIKYLQPGNQDKLIRATPAILAAEQGHLYIPHNAPAWLEPFLYELVQFTGDSKLDAFDDVVDCLAYACLNMNFAHFEAPSSAGTKGQNRSPYDKGQGPRPQDGMGRVFARAGRMRRLFGGG